MTAVTEPFPSNKFRKRTASGKAKVINSFAASTVTTMTPMIKQTHNTSLASLAHNFAHRVSNHQENYQRFSASLLKHKNLLVPTRLAIKRQQAALKYPSLQYEPMRSDGLQIELGTTDDELIRYNQRTPPSPDYTQTKTTLYQSGPVREDTPHTLPTDISLMYREKPSFFHPITGQYIVQYSEDNGSPSPCSYVLPRKSYREKSAPAYTFGTRCLVEKKGGSRTSWHKQWFANSNPFTTKVDFNREDAWPTPFHYHAQPTLGFQATKLTFPSWSIAERLQDSPIPILEDHPAPDSYDTTKAFQKLTAKGTPITLKSRVGGTQISINQSIGVTPGPGAHDESKFLSNRRSSPKHSFGKRVPISLRQDPYINVVSSSSY